MTDRYGVAFVTRFTLMALSLTLIVLSALALTTAASTPSVLAASADRTGDADFDTLELTDDLVAPVNVVQVAWSPVVSSLTLTAVIEWAWSSTPPTRPPKSSNFS